MVVRSLTYDNLPLFGDVDSNEPNDSQGNATEAQSGAQIQARISSPSDVDWYKINVTTPGILRLHLDVPADKDYDLQLLVPPAAPLISQNGTGLPEDFTQEIVTPGEYYFRVYGYPDGNGSFSATENYSITATITPLSDLVGWWKFDGSVADSGPNALNGVNYGGTFVPDRHGSPNSALRLRGHKLWEPGGLFVPSFKTGDYVRVPIANGQPALGSTFSIAFWMRPLTPMISTPYGSGPGLGEMAIVAQHMPPSNTQGTWGMHMSWQTPSVQFSGSPIWDVYPNGQQAVPVGEWTHVCFTYGSSGWAFYLNGVETSSGTDVFQEMLPLYDLIIGAAGHPDGVGDAPGDTGGQLAYFYDGDLDDLRLYNRPLTASEVALLANDVAGSINDPFDHLNTSSVWEIVGGDWSVANGKLTASWSQSLAQTDQANLLLRGANPAVDYDASFTAVLPPNGETGFSLYSSPGNKYNINLYRSGLTVERRQDSSNYSIVAQASFSPAPDGTNSTVILRRRGATYTVLVNNVEVLQFTDTVWGGQLRVGLRSYGTAVYDAFTYNAAGLVPAPTISSIGAQTIATGASTGALAFTLTDASSSLDSLSVTGSSSNTALVPADHIVFGGSGGNRTVTVTPTGNLIGTATITLTVNDGLLSANSSFDVTVFNGTALVTLGGLSATYNGAPHAATATTVPAGLKVNLTYNGLTTPPTNAGSYTVVATVDDATYSGSASGTLVIAKASVNGGKQVIDSSSFSDGTVPAGWLAWPSDYGSIDFAGGRMNAYAVDATNRIYRSISVDPNATGLTITYRGNTANGSWGGSNYAVVGLNNGDPIQISHGWGDSSGGTGGTLMSAEIYQGNTKLHQELMPRTFEEFRYTITVRDGQISHRAVRTNDEVAFDYTVDVPGLLLANVNRLDLAVYQTVLDPLWIDDVEISTTESGSDINFSGLDATYDGTPKTVSATTSPAGLNVVMTYNGSGTAPTNAGTYAIVGTINDPNYAGSGAATLVIAKATPVVTWGAPVAITYGTALSSTQLNASANVPGSLVFLPNAGTVLDAGSQPLSVTFTPTDTANYTGATAATTLAVTQAPATFVLSSTTFTYNGASQGPTIIATPSGTSFTTEGTSTATNAGNYTATATATGNYTGSNNALNWSIAAAGQPAPVVSSPSSVTFGNAYSATANSGYGALSWALGSGSTAPGAAVNATTGTISYSGVGTVVIKAQFAGDTNHNASPFGGDFSVTVNAVPAAFALSATTFVYNGASQGPTIIATPSGTSFTTGGTSTATNAGNYTATATATGNYIGTNSALNWSISKATATVNLGGLSATYDGTAKGAIAATSPAGLAVAMTYNGSATAPTNAGSYAVVATITDPNYSGSASGTLVIAKATPVVSWGAPAAITYPAALGPTQLNASANVSGSFAYSPTAGTVLNAGSQTLGVSFTPTDAANYNGATGSTTLTVNKAAATFALSSTGFTYSGALQGPTVNATPGNTTFTTGGTLTATNAGNYTATATANGNYTGSNSTLNWSISKAAATVTLGGLSATYDGTPKGATATTSPGGLNVALTYNGGATGPTNAGSYAVVATVNDANYSGSATGTLVIAKASTSGGKQAIDSLNFDNGQVPAGWLAWPNNYGNIDFAGGRMNAYSTDATNRIYRSISVDPSATSVAISYRGNTAGGFVGGSNYVVIGLSNGDPIQVSHGWGDSSGGTSGTQMSAEIYQGNSKLHQELMPRTFEEFRYTITIQDGKVSHRAVRTNDEVAFDYTVDVPGLLLANINRLDLALYQTVLDPLWIDDVEISTNQSGPTLTLGGLAATYDGSPKPASATTSPTGLNVTLTYNGSATPPTNAGSYTVVATVNDPNYTGSASGSLVIAKATPTITWSSPAAITYPAALGATQLNASANVPGAFVYLPAAGAVLNAGSQALGVTFTPTDTANYTGAAGSTTLTVNQAAATFALSSTGFTYNGSLQGPTINATPSGATFTPGGTLTATNAGNYTATATANGNYAGSNFALNWSIAKATPTIFWAAPAHITHGTPLSGAQLNAFSAVSGTFSYNPFAGTILGVGPQLLTATFTPTDTANYNGAIAQVTLTVDPAASHPAADFNGDGKSDLLWQNVTTGARYVWQMDGSAFIASHYLGAVATQWSIATTGDFNGDGVADIVWENSATGERFVWFMSGSAYSSGSAIAVIDPQWHIAGTGDFDGDGQTDLILENSTTGDRYLWLMNGTTYQSYVYLGNIAPQWHVVGTGDFNGDGKPDILWENTSTGARFIWLMNKEVFQSSVSLGTVPTSWHIAGTGDFNGDGKPDIIWENTSTGARVIWLMDGAAVLSSVHLPTISTDWSIRN